MYDHNRRTYDYMVIITARTLLVHHYLPPHLALSFPHITIRLCGMYYIKYLSALMNPYAFMPFQFSNFGVQRALYLS